MEDNSINTSDSSYIVSIKEAVKVDFDKKLYNKKYYEKKKEELKTTDCDICYGSYNMYSRATHMKSKKHLKAVDIINKK
jgi:hypothetical protein